MNKPWLKPASIPLPRVTYGITFIIHLVLASDGTLPWVPGGTRTLDLFPYKPLAPSNGETHFPFLSRSPGHSAILCHLHYSTNHFHLLWFTFDFCPALTGPTGSSPGFLDPACLHHCDEYTSITSAVFVYKAACANCTNFCNVCKDRQRHITYVNVKNIISVKTR